MLKYVTSKQLKESNMQLLCNSVVITQPSDIFGKVRCEADAFDKCLKRQSQCVTAAVASRCYFAWVGDAGQILKIRVNPVVKNAQNPPWWKQLLPDLQYCPLLGKVVTSLASAGTHRLTNCGYCLFCFSPFLQHLLQSVVWKKGR